MSGAIDGKGAAGTSGCMQPACGTIVVCKPLCALQETSTPAAAFDTHS